MANDSTLGFLYVDNGENSCRGSNKGGATISVRERGYKRWQEITMSEQAKPQRKTTETLKNFTATASLAAVLFSASGFIAVRTYINSLGLPVDATFRCRATCSTAGGFSLFFLSTFS